MKKILFLIHDLNQGGAEKVLVNLVNHMDQTRFHVTVMALFGGGVNEQFLAPHITLINCHKRTIRGNSHLMKLFSPEMLYRHYIRRHYDVIVSYLEGPCARIVSGCNDPDTKILSWIHGEQKNRKKASRGFRSFKEAAECYGRFHQTVCVSETVKEDFLALFPNCQNVIVRYNTNDTTAILAAAKEQPAAWPANPNRIQLIGVGKIINAKGFDRLTRIHKRLIEDGFPVQTNILGIGPLQASLEKYLKEHGLSDSFTFLGYQTNPYQYLARSDLFVCASHAEGFSTAATEALIVGTPVVTTLVSGMEEMLGHNQFGIITENNEEALYQGIRKLLSDPGLLAHYRQMAVLRGKDFQTQQTVSAVEALLDE